MVKVIIAIVGYSLCSSTLLLANKIAVDYIPESALISLSQFSFATIVCLILPFCGVAVDQLELAKMPPYVKYSILFGGSIFANLKALKGCNVETIIVFRALSPLAVSIIDWMFMGREFPNARSCASLTMVAIGAYVYCTTDSEFKVQGIKAYFWVLLYFVLIVIEMVYAKHIISSVKMETVWGPVLYNNMLTIPIGLLLATADGEFWSPNTLQSISNCTAFGWFALSFACAVGLAIGYVLIMIYFTYHNKKSW